MTTEHQQQLDLQRLQRLDRQQDAMATVARRWRQYEGDLSRAVRDFTECSARALGFQRVSVWFYDDERRSILCADLFDAATGAHTRGAELLADQYPDYFAAIETEAVIPTEDAFTDPRCASLVEPYLKPLGIGAMLDAPIRARGKMVGVLCHEHVGGPRRFHHDEMSTAAFLADVIGAGMDFQRYDQAMRHEEERLRDEMLLWRVLFEQSLDGIVILEQDGSIYETNQRFADMLGYSLEELRRLHVWDWDTQFGREALLGMIGTLDETGAHFETRQRRKDGSEIDVELSNNGATYKGRRLAFCRVRDITDRKLAQEQIRQLATTDGLTGLRNRAEFTRLLEAEIERNRRYGTPFSLLMYDIDSFKQVNDRFGHDGGDDVIRAVTTAVSEHLRVTDVHARWGGEEFMVLLPETGLAAAVTVAEKLRRAIAGGRYLQDHPCTASFGVSEFDPRGDTDTFLKRIDEALYRAKARGRNRVETARTLPHAV